MLFLSMRNFTTISIIILLFSCSHTEKRVPFTSVDIETVYNDSISIRAIEIMGNSVAFAGNNGTYGTIEIATNKARSNIEKYHTSIPEFRSVGHTATDFFMLSVGNPALLYKTGNHGKMNLVYKEEGDGVFYDALTFWNNKEGIAAGDNVNGCFSIIITRDGGNAWQKIPCNQLPEPIEGEGAFAASNTNIKTIGDKTWIATTKRVLFSSDKGNTWEAFETPILTEKESQGIYSIDFYNENIGVVIGGDYTNSEVNMSNKAITLDGGKTWRLLADGQNPGYKSCVQFVPNSKGNELISIGFTGISYSRNMGDTWQQLSDEPFYTIRFVNDSIGYAAGKYRISKLIFK